MDAPSKSTTAMLLALESIFPLPGEVHGCPATSASSQLLDPRLILLDAGCRTKPDAIELGVQLLHRADRTRQPRELAHSLWQREASSPTSVGFGCAMPHCKSSAALVNSLVILKPRIPLDWAAPDHPPVTLIFLIAVQAATRANAHLQMLAHLARKMLDGDFRDHVGRQTNSAALCAFLEISLTTAGRII